MERTKMPKLRNGSKCRIQTRALSIASPAFYHRATALHTSWPCMHVILLLCTYSLLNSDSHALIHFYENVTRTVLSCSSIIYCNLVLNSIPKQDLSKLQHVQNHLAFDALNSLHLLLKQLLLLPVNHRIIYNYALHFQHINRLTYSVLHLSVVSHGQHNYYMFYHKVFWHEQLPTLKFYVCVSGNDAQIVPVKLSTCCLSQCGIVWLRVMCCRVTCAPGRHPSHTPFCRDSDCCGITSASLGRNSRAIPIKVCTNALWVLQ